MIRPEVYADVERVKAYLKSELCHQMRARQSAAFNAGHPYTDTDISEVVDCLFSTVAHAREFLEAWEAEVRDTAEIDAYWAGKKGAGAA